MTPEDGEVRADALAELGIVALEHLQSPPAAYFPSIAALQLSPEAPGRGDPRSCRYRSPWAVRRRAA